MTENALLDRIRAFDSVRRTGRVRKILPTHIEADGPNVRLGALCTIDTQPQGSFQAEVVKIDQSGIVLSPLEQTVPTFSGALVTAVGMTSMVPVGPAFLGRAVDALGRPLDGLGPVRTDREAPLHGEATSPLDRASPQSVFETGIRAVDGLLTLGKGQRVGVFAASGVGKTTLMSQIVSQAEADIAILCLVGERGREVETIWNHHLDADARAKATLVAATSDQSAAMRVRAGYYALALAEYWRGQGRHVLLVLDSVTRLAMAMREIGLAAGEPPTVRAYTPGVFAAIPKIVERCGALKSGGAITAVMTVLSETDELDDPVCELMKSLLDGHILLSRTLAEQGHYPAIDVSRSISRLADSLAIASHRADARKVLEWLSLRESSRVLIDTGLYMKGSNAGTDQAIQKYPEILRFLKQSQTERVDMASTTAAINRLATGRL